MSSEDVDFEGLELIEMRLEIDVPKVLAYLEANSDFPPGGDDSLPSLEQVIGSEPTPEFAAQMDEQVAQLMKKLDEESLAKIAQLKLEGYENTEIAQQLEVGLRTVERKLARIRTLWTDTTNVG